MNDVELNLREILLPVLGLDTIADIGPEQALVQDLGADSLDFVEIVFLVEKNFGVSIETNELVTGGVKHLKKDVPLFADGKLTPQGLLVISEAIPWRPDRFTEGMSKIDIFKIIAVKDLATIIHSRMKNQAAK